MARQIEAYDPDLKNRQPEAPLVRTASSDDDVQRRLEQEEVRKFLTKALTRFKLAADHEAAPRKSSLDDWKFAMGEQWTPDIQSQRVSDGRPCLVMDHLKQSIRQVTNEQRQQRPSIQINPAGDGATRGIADVLQGMVRHIEVLSDAEVAYDSAFEHMVIGGDGWLRVLTEYIPGTFDQEIKIKHIRNKFTVYSDPAAMEPDKSDAKWRFIIEDVPREEYKILYPESEAASLEDFTSVGDMASSWGSKEAIRVAEYFHVEEELVPIVKLADGRVINQADLKPEDGEPVDRRDEVQKKVFWSKINAVERLEEQSWPGSIIPLVPVLGEDHDLDGRAYRAGLVRNAKDPQRMYNYQCSAATELSALAPRAPYIGPKGSFKSSESQWKAVNQKNFSYIEYDIVNGPGGSALPPPERIVAETPIQGAVLLMKAAGDDLKASLGIYDASLGAPGPEQSGRAILARQKQGDVATLNFSDNLSRALRCVGRILVEVIPKIYDAPRVQRIINPDQSIKNVTVYNSTAGFSPDEARALVAADQSVIPEIYDIGVGRYDVTVTTGPSYQSKRAEAAASVQALVEAYPQIMQVAGDLIVANMDWPYAAEIAKRFKKTMQPNLIDDKDQSPEAKQAALEQQLNQATQQAQQAGEALQQAHQIIQTKTVENDAKIKIEQVRAETQIALKKLEKETQLAVAEVTTKAQDAIQRRRMENDVFLATHDAAHELATAATQPQAAQGGSDQGAVPAAQPQATPQPQGGQ